MTGTERALLYRLAAETGLRAGELRSLTKASFELEGHPPFFRAGGELRLEDFGPRSIVLGVRLAGVLLPLRALQIALLQSRGSSFTWGERRRVGIALLPTLVFSIVLLDILRERFGLESPLVGGVIVYTIIDTVLPGFLSRVRQASAEAPALVGESAARAGALRDQ